MVRKAKITVSIDGNLLRDLDELSREHELPRSQVVERAIRRLRDELQERRLREGYRAMAEEDRATAEDRLGAWAEVDE